MALPTFFTYPDETLIQESSVDPMGMLVIWTEFGQAIFDNRITTIANNLRAFNFNLFHSYILYKLELDFPNEVANACAKYIGWSNDKNWKPGMYIFLEDLVTHLFYMSTNQDVDKEGILGMNKAKAAHKDNYEKIVIVADKEKGLLKNQLNLGMMGRYKGPFLSMKLFKTAQFEFEYSNWKNAIELFTNWNEANKLIKLILKFVTEIVFKGKRGTHPALTIRDIETSGYWKKLQDGYLECFGKAKINKDARIFWLKQLGLKDGAAGVIFKEVNNTLNQETINHKLILNNALQACSDKGEKHKIENVLNVEDFLSYTEFVFKFIANPSVTNINDHLQDLEKVRQLIKQTRIENFNTTNKRLIKLREAVLKNGNTLEWVNSLVGYHEQIMKERFGNAWFKIEPDGKVKHLYNYLLPNEIDTIAKYLKEKRWLHDYYLFTLRSIARSLN